MNMVKGFFKLYSLPVLIMVRPFAGFYQMKFEQKGTVRLALFNFLLVCVAFAFSSQYTSIFIDSSHPMNMNSLWDAALYGGMLLLFCTANWSASTITRGEGRFKDILMAVCYAMTPMIFTVVAATVISNFLTAQETGFYYMLISAGSVYFVFLCFIGLLTVHNYGAVKALIMIFLTFAAMIIIVFLGALFFTLLTQLTSFISGLYTEIVFRF
jgi:hypothetical protein